MWITISKQCGDRIHNGFLYCGCEVISASGRITFHWHDRYNFNSGEKAFLPDPDAFFLKFQVMPDNIPLMLEKIGRAASFNMDSYWNESIQWDSDTCELGSLGVQFK